MKLTKIAIVSVASLLFSEEVQARRALKKKQPTLQACLGSYPGTSTGVSGKVTVKIDPDTDDIYFGANLNGLEPSVTGGIHIHTGTVCAINDLGGGVTVDLVGGHYWDVGTGGTLIPDPWTAAYGAVYTTNKKGKGKAKFMLNSGYGYDSNIGHAVVVHDSNGLRVACGVLTDEKLKKCPSGGPSLKKV